MISVSTYRYQYVKLWNPENEKNKEFLRLDFSIVLIHPYMRMTNNDDNKNMNMDIGMSSVL